MMKPVEMYDSPTISPLEDKLDAYKPPEPNNGQRGSIKTKLALGLGAAAIIAAGYFTFNYFREPEVPITPPPIEEAVPLEPEEPPPEEIKPILPDFYVGKTSYKEIEVNEDGSAKYEFSSEIGNKSETGGKAVVELLYKGEAIAEKEVYLGPNSSETEKIEAALKPGDYEDLKLRITSEAEDAYLPDNTGEVEDFKVPELADLVIDEENVHYEKLQRNEDESITYNITLPLINSGGRDVENVNVKLYSTEFEEALLAELNELKINAGESLEETINITLAPGKHKVSVNVEYGGYEKSKENNEHTFDIDVESLPADLGYSKIPGIDSLVAISSSSTQVEIPGRIEVNKTYYLMVNVKNDGKTTAAANPLNVYSNEIGLENIIATAEIPQLEPGESALVVAEIKFSSEGEYTLYAVIDPENIVPEAEEISSYNGENNNTTETTIEAVRISDDGGGGGVSPPPEEEERPRKPPFGKPPP